MNKPKAPMSFFRLLLASACGKISDQLTNARTSLPWLLEQIGAPTYFFGLLVPLRESLSMLPQILLSPWINRFHYRKGFWIGAAIVQALCIMTTPLCLFFASPLLGALWVVILLTIFSLSRCFCSITFKDIIGKVIPATSRGRLTGYASGLAGIVVLGSGLSLFLSDDESLSRLPVLILFFCSGLLWLLGALFIWQVAEPAGEADGETPLFAAIRANFRLLSSERDLRMLVISRGFLLCPILAAPYLVVLASENASINLLGSLIIINGLAGTLSAPLWGHLADYSSKRCMLAGGLLSSCAILVAWYHASGLWQTGDLNRTALYLGFFAALSIGHSGIRTGRKTYAANIAEGNRRTQYVSISNTMIGIVLLCVGFSVSIIATWSISALILVLALSGLFGTAVSTGMRESSEYKA